jgi:hypothetical protein
MRRLLIVGAMCAATVATPGPADALPRGCASVSDFDTGVDVAARSLVAHVNVDEPCTFRYAAGDTYSGSGRFTISCAGGVTYTHPDFQNGQYPPVVNVPIPTPCPLGAVVTIEAYHLGSGGSVVAGGI